MTSATTSQWNAIITSLQDIYNFNESQSLDSLRSETGHIANKELATFLTKLSSLLSDNYNTDVDIDQLKVNLQSVQDHLHSMVKSQDTLTTMMTTLSSLIANLDQQEQEKNRQQQQQQQQQQQNAASVTAPAGGKQYWTSSYNPVSTIPINSEVAYKPRKNTMDEEWFQCIVLKVSADGIRYEVQDPEPDELGNAGKIFKCTWKELIPIPPKTARISMKPYPMGTKVLARYPETTTFYPAVVSRDHKKETKICKLRFDGEEEVNKETEVDRRLVLPFPTISAMPVNNARRS